LVIAVRMTIERGRFILPQTFSVSSLAIVILPEADPDNEKQHLLQITIPHVEQRTIRNWPANGQINRLDFG
jgi:hypothetical protein